MQNFEHSAAQATDILFQQIAPEASLVVRPYLARLFQALDDGHSFIVVSAAQAQELAQAYPLVGHSQTPLILQQRRLFIAKYLQLEQKLAYEIQRLSHSKQPENDEWLNAKLHHWFADSGSQDQQAAAALALISSFILISGGPGTGKTTTVAKLLALLCQNKTLPEIRLVAPTGKAAARLTEALRNAIQTIPDLDSHVEQHLSQLTAQTVHRLLGLTPPQMQPKYHAQNPLYADVLLLDEASMLDSELLYQLLNALPNHCRVILLGDANQLPAVGMGAVLAAFNQAPPLTVEQQQYLQQLLPQRPLPHNLSQQHARLTISHRFTHTSGIGQLANAVLTGDGAHAWAQFQHFPQALSHQQISKTHLAEQLFKQHENYWQAIEKKDIQAAFAALNQIIILTATRQDADQINQAYQNLLQQQQRIAPNETFFIGQVIMISRNEHTQKLYNGDIGIIHQHDEYLSAYFLDGQTLRAIAISRLPEHDTAFAITVHKSQGSEYEQVWFVAPQQTTHSNRALLYTALTRAKQQFCYIGDAASFQAACEQTESRRSVLTEYLFASKTDVQAA